MRFTLAAAAFALLPAALGTITITGPSSSAYWVFNATNTITWTFTAGDPSPVNIVVVNSDNTTLNGPFAISNNVDLSNSSFTVTNVTLRPGQNYQVEFVSPQNESQVLATSASFPVMPNGTAPAPTASASSSASSTASSSGSSASSTAPSGSGSAAPSPTGNGAAPLAVSSVFGAIAACGAIALASLF